MVTITKRKTCAFFSFVLLTLLPIQSFALHRRQKLPQIQEFDTKQYLIDFAKMYAKDWAAVIAHELGHAFISKTLAGNDINIHFGLTTSENRNILSLGKKPITFHSIFPLAGFAYVVKTDSAWKNALIALAGPACGMLTYFTINLYNKYKQAKKPLNKVSREELLKMLKESGSDPDIAYHAIYNLIPLGTNDGNRILRSLFPSSPTEKSTFFCALMKLTQIVLQDRVINSLKKKQKKDPGSLVFDKEQVKQANRIIMLLSHKAMGTLKEWTYEENLESGIDPENTFQGLDLIYVVYLIKYIESIKKIYVK